MNYDMSEEIEKKLQSQLKTFADGIRKVAEEALGDLEVGLLPYVLGDTDCNVQAQTSDLIQQVIAGQFEWDGDYIVFSAREYAPRIRIAFSKSRYDAIRDAIIERMPKCPKDEKIASLEQELKLAYERRY